METTYWQGMGEHDAREDWELSWSRGPRTRESIAQQMRVNYEIVLMDESDPERAVGELVGAYVATYQELGGEVQ